MDNIYQTMSALAKQVGAINLAQGIPENLFDDHWQRAVCGQKKNDWQYMPTQGMHELLEQIDAMYGNQQAFITAGCTEALLSGLFSFKKMGYKRLVVFEPFYSYYFGMAELAGLNFLPIPLSIKAGQFNLDSVALSKQIQDEKSILLINSPHNPTGMTVGAQAWEQLLQLSDHDGHALLIDDVYRDFNYVKRTTPYKILSTRTTLIASSLSKSLAGSGVRIGWLAGNERCLLEAQKAHTHMSNCMPEILQKAAITMMKAQSNDKKEWVRQRYKKRRERLYQALMGTGLDAFYPDGGHFIVAKWNALPTSVSTWDLCKTMTHEIGVTPLPLDSFFIQNPDRYIRFSFAVRDDDLTEACLRLSKLSVDKYYV